MFYECILESIIKLKYFLSGDYYKSVQKCFIVRIYLTVIKFKDTLTVLLYLCLFIRIYSLISVDFHKTCLKYPRNGAFKGSLNMFFLS